MDKECERCGGPQDGERCEACEALRRDLGESPPEGRAEDRLAEPVAQSPRPIAAPMAAAPVSKAPVSVSTMAQVAAAAPPTVIREPVSLGGVLTGVLREPDEVARDAGSDQGLGSLTRLAVVLTVSMTLVGLVIGSFGGGWQLLLVPAKVAGGFLFAAAVCFPSLYIISALSGGRQSFRHVMGAQLVGLSVTAILLVGFAPIVWIFSQSTTSPSFMGFVHLVVFGLSSLFGAGALLRALRGTGGRSPLGGLMWCGVFFVVVLQLSTTLRPLVGEYEGAVFSDKQFFLEHWGEALGHELSGEDRHVAADLHSNIDG